MVNLDIRLERKSVKTPGAEFRLKEARNIFAEILAMMRGERFTAEDAMRRLGLALHHIHESTAALKDIDGVER